MKYTVEHVSGEDYKSELASYAYSISGNDKTFVALLEAENGAWTHDRKHVVPYYLCWDGESWGNRRAPNQAENVYKCNEEWEGWFWRKHFDWGYCGMSDGYKKHITDDPKFLSDTKWQIDQCFEQYSIGTKFYGLSKTDSTVYNFTFHE